MATKLQKSMLQPIAVIYKFVTAVRPGLGGAMRVALSCPSRATAARERLPARAQSPNARLPPLTSPHLVAPNPALPVARLRRRPRCRSGCLSRRRRGWRARCW
jgi:hypothetical protein